MCILCEFSKHVANKSLKKKKVKLCQHVLTVCNFLQCEIAEAGHQAKNKKTPILKNVYIFRSSIQHANKTGKNCSIALLMVKNFKDFL